MSKARLTESMMEWKDIPWRKLERIVFKLQKRIFKASQRGDVKAVRKLQKTLMRSWSAKCIAVRRVSQDNQGKKTAGVDGVKSLTPVQRLKLVDQLKVTRKAKPTRRVWIPKPGTEEKRPLGIPTMYDRALQALLKLTLEPEWEARFEPNSYGFRPGRSTHDAIGQIHTAICKKPKYVLDADISKCFDRINHQALLKKLDTFPTMYRQIRAWLKSGVMDGETLFPTTEGTPQGGVISPLLANIALHGMENLINQSFPRKKIGVRENGTQINSTAPDLVRYADDFVILHEDLSTIQKCQEIITEWLKDLGLELKPSKTKLAHTLIKSEGELPGFDFLGFNVRQHPVGKYIAHRDRWGKAYNFRTIIKPSKEGIRRHLDKLREIIKTHKAAPQAALIKHLNPVIRGWANYYRTVASNETFNKIDNLIYLKLRSWAKGRHPNKVKGWVARRYWHAIKNNNWVFATRKEGNPLILFRHSDVKIIRPYAKVKGNSSPMDGNLTYWSTRLGKHPELSSRISTLLKIQKGKCPHCGLLYKDGDIWEVDHITPRSKGGRDGNKNFQLLHRHCHDSKTIKDNT